MAPWNLLVLFHEKAKIIVVVTYTKSASVALNIILTHVTKGLRTLCLWLSIIGGVDVKVTQEPSDPSYFKNGSDANLVWNYTDPLNEVQGIIFSVLENGVFVKMIYKDSHGVKEYSSIPLSYKGRFKIEGRATLVIKNINPKDNTKIKFETWGSLSSKVDSTVQLIVIGTYYRLNH